MFIQIISLQKALMIAKLPIDDRISPACLPVAARSGDLPHTFAAC
jgi:hypothetical protein